jgi:hypothetical protein
VATHLTEPIAFFLRAVVQVYDVTKFLKLHPGGKKVLLGVGGQECTEQFNQFHNAAAVIAKYGPKLLIGDLEGGASAKKASSTSTAVVPAKRAPVVNVPIGINEPFGDQIPYGDPAWYQGSCTRMHALRDLHAGACSDIHAQTCLRGLTTHGTLLHQFYRVLY